MGLICAVTGARGYVGSHIAKELELAGHKVLRLGRDRLLDDRHFTLGEPVTASALEDADAVIHCAYDFHPRTAAEDHRINVEGSLRLLETARMVDVQRFIFISSVSAFDGCRSFYGRGKLVVEQAVRAVGGIAVRPGLVYGDPGRGMFGTLTRLARLPLLPVFGSGRQPFVLVHVVDLARAIVQALEWNISRVEGPVVLAHPEQVAFADILRFIAQRQGRRLRILPIPSMVGMFLLRTIETMGLSAGFRSDSLVSLLNPNPGLDFTLPEKLGIRFRRFSDAGPEIF